MKQMILKRHNDSRTDPRQPSNENIFTVVTANPALHSFLTSKKAISCLMDPENKVFFRRMPIVAQMLTQGTGFSNEHV
jgi:hypothetical protein